VIDAYLDINVIIRYLTGDDPQKQMASSQLFEQIERGELEVTIPLPVIDEASYVLASNRNYGPPWDQVADMLSALIRNPGIDVDNKDLVLESLGLVKTDRVDFADAYIVASMRRNGASTLYSYDQDFDEFADIDRIEP
jgi:predicted nucleic acid-binding protein